MLVIHYQNCLSQVKLLISCKTDEQMCWIVTCKHILLRLLKTSEVVGCNFPKNKNFHGIGTIVGLSFCDWNSIHTTRRNPPGFSWILSYKKLVLFLKFLHFVNNNNRGAPKICGRGAGAAALQPPLPKSKCKKCRFCRDDDIKNFPWLTIWLKSSNEIGWWLVY
jgi:hypothetical protein